LTTTLNPWNTVPTNVQRQVLQVLVDMTESLLRNEKEENDE